MAGQIGVGFLSGISQAREIIKSRAVIQETPAVQVT